MASTLAPLTTGYVVDAPKGWWGSRRAVLILRSLIVTVPRLLAFESLEKKGESGQAALKQKERGRMVRVKEVNVVGLRQTHFTQLLAYLNDRDKEGWYYGYREQFERRHEELRSWLEGVIGQYERKEKRP